MKKINIKELEIELLEKTKNTKFKLKKDLSDFVDENIVQRIERENNIYVLKDVYEYIENVDQFRDCINIFINNFDFESEE